MLAVKHRLTHLLAPRFAQKVCSIWQTQIRLLYAFLARVSSVFVGLVLSGQMVYCKNLAPYKTFIMPKSQAIKTDCVSLAKTPAAIRRRLRRARLMLSPVQRRHAAGQAVRQLSRLPLPRQPQRPLNIGVYADAFGELPTQGLIDWVRRRGWRVFLPVVTRPHRALRFRELATPTLKSARLARHPLAMRQPAYGALWLARDLDVLFVPLVALDDDGYRLGMGGGFYDRTLARHKHKPLVIGWAYDCQRVAHLPRQPWDARLDMAVLPSGVVDFRQRYDVAFTQQSAKNLANAALRAPTAANAAAVFDDSGVFDDNDVIPVDDTLAPAQIAAVMNPNHLAQLLAKADAFLAVNRDTEQDF